MTNFQIYLKEYLKAYWLRPVTALWRALEAELLNFDKCKPKGRKSMELACGDGINSFIASGGKVPIIFDAFESVVEISSKEFYIKKTDIYDSYDKDVYNNVIFPNDIKFDYGIDHKNNLIKKARILNMYNELIVLDLNKDLPNEDSSVDFIFSNSIYWIENIDHCLSEINRVLSSRGVCKFIIIKDRFIDNTLWKKLGKYKFKQFLDMGRHKHYKQLRSCEEWDYLFKKAGLKIKNKLPIVNDNLAHMVEFHDLREISPVTASMAAKLDDKNLIETKNKWIDYYYFLFNEMYKDKFLVATEQNSNYYIYNVIKG